MSWNLKCIAYFQNPYKGCCVHNNIIDLIANNSYSIFIRVNYNICASTYSQFSVQISTKNSHPISTSAYYFRPALQCPEADICHVKFIYKWSVL